MRTKSKKHTKLRDFTCVICKEIKQDYFSPSETKKTCSKVCRAELNRIHKRKGSFITCIKCNKLFWIRPSENRRGSARRHCSRTCYRKDPTLGVGRHISYDGYWIVKGKKEHRVLMEQAIGRKLLPSEIVHHINEDKLDNRIENLQIVSRAEHNRIHGFFNKNRNHFKGVYYRKRKNRWCAIYRDENKKLKYIGQGYKTEQEATNARELFMQQR